MKTSFDYIGDVVDKVIEAEPQLSEKEKWDADKASKKIIGGFRVKDGQAEKNYLDAVVAQKRRGIELFLQHRKTAKEDLGKVGINIMAVVPTKAWEKICYDTGLYILAPNAQGRVGYNATSVHALNGWGKWSDAAIDKYAKANWPKFLDAMFEKRKAMLGGGVYSATLVLPDPPEDVAAILCKAQNIGLKVAAVAEAISFVEKPSEIVKRSGLNSKDLWAQARGYEDYADWVKRDPIVFAEYGSATAIIAQFGDFPIEKEVVDAVLATNDLLPEGVNPQVATVQMPMSVEDQYRQAMAQGLSQGYGMGIGTAPQVYGGLSGSYGTNTTAVTVGYTTNSFGNVVPVVNSQSWTGR